MYQVKLKYLFVLGEFGKAFVDIHLRRVRRRVNGQRNIQLLGLGPQGIEVWMSRGFILPIEGKKEPAFGTGLDRPLQFASCFFGIVVQRHLRNRHQPPA